MDKNNVITLDLSSFSPFELSIFVAQLRKLVVENKEYKGQEKVPSYLYNTIAQHLEKNGYIKQI